MIEEVVIEYSEWCTKYKPIQNNICRSAGFDGTMFETYGEEVQKILNTNSLHVWTYISGENENDWIVPGYYLVNRLGYFITEVPWNDDSIVVDLNEYLTKDEAIKACYLFWKNEGFEFNMNAISTLYPNDKYSIGDAKYIAMDLYTQETGQEELTDRQQDRIHDYYSQIV